MLVKKKEKRKKERLNSVPDGENQMWCFHNRRQWRKELSYFGISKKKENLHHFVRITHSQQSGLTTQSNEALILNFEDICKFHLRKPGIRVEFLSLQYSSLS